MKKLLAVMLAFTLLVGCGARAPKGSISAADATSKVVLHGNTYTLPVSIETLMDDGWEMDEYFEFDSLKPNQRETTFMKKGEDEIYVTAVNPTKKESMKDVVVTEIEVELDFFSTDEYEFFGGIRLEDDYDQVKDRLKGLELLSYDKDWGYIAYGVEGKKLDIAVSNRNKIKSITLVNYGEWDEYDFRYSVGDSDDDEDEENPFDGSDIMSDYYWILSNEEEIRTQGDANRKDHPLDDLESFLGKKYGAYRLEGKVLSRTETDEVKGYTIKDNSGATIIVDASDIDDFLDGEKIANGTEIVLYVSQVEVIEESLLLNSGIAMIVLMMEVNGQSYSYYK